MMDKTAMKWKLLYDVHGATFCGIEMMQYWAELAVWEQFLNEYWGIKRIIELGTARGGFSLFLWLQCQQRGMEFWTFDRAKPAIFVEPSMAGMFLSGNFHQGDIFEGSMGTVTWMLKTLPLILLYCDNGDKAKEMNTFVPMMRSGSYVAVHDWGVEVGPVDIEPIADLIEPVFVEESTALSPHLTRFWRVK